ncbi:hypothetical protein [Dolichospermum circinale]|uniref:hypothetical protein n=1 Tax=Dolichospermum circinale TaxID=109265 RepID=UPI00232D2AEE|nr:hypothetical protein [Dolichospermum circinale]MDB9454021.1 hypothetical protein [Dolichospermum circinale CS-541/06]MDB9463196.1 hypothetical protein [Dolichospermum circinale CS-541/04]MDB9549001.1 hypothetical protein [Dolichospermum circinale CS-1031]
MYNSQELFIKDAQSCGSNYYSYESLQPHKISVAYAIYQKARQGSILGFSVVGRWKLKNEMENILLPSDESFPSIDDSMKNNLLTIDEDFTKESGCILNSENWTLIANDAWVIGGIHANTDFHFASPLRWSNLWNNDRKRMSITAREIIGITSFGYKIIKPNPKLEAVALCVDNKKAMSASLVKYKEKVEIFQEYKALQVFFKSLPSNVTE